MQPFVGQEHEGRGQHRLPQLSVYALVERLGGTCTCVMRTVCARRCGRSRLGAGVPPRRLPSTGPSGTRSCRAGLSGAAMTWRVASERVRKPRPPATSFLSCTLAHLTSTLTPLPHRVQKLLRKRAAGCSALFLGVPHATHACLCYLQRVCGIGGHQFRQGLGEVYVL